MVKDRIILEFSLNKHPLSSMIPKVMQGEYSHVSVVWDENTLFSARFIHGVGPHEFNTENYVKQEYWAVNASSSRVCNWLRQQLGKGYDNKGVLRFLNIFYALSQSQDRFFCSELAFSAAFVNNPYFRSKFKRIDPSTVDVLTLRQMLMLLSGMKYPSVSYLGNTLTKDVLL
jgi:hypothetical protein